MRFLLVDRITEWVPGGRVRGVKCVAMSEDFLEHHFPGNPIMPGVLMLEALLQLAAWGEAASSQFSRWLLLRRVQRCGFYELARPGDTIELEVEPLGGAGGGRRSYRGVGVVGGGKRIVAEFEAEPWPLADLADPEVQRAAFDILTREGRG
jgi:3-hydroxyacyl-[acyl-carrier-protein] dehydratase